MRVVPRDPLQRRELRLVDAFPRPASVDHFRLVKPDDGLRERVVVRIARAADGPLDAGLGQPLGVVNREISGRFTTIRTARAGTSGEDLVGLDMAPSSQEIEPPGKPARFTRRRGATRCQAYGWLGLRIGFDVG